MTGAAEPRYWRAGLRQTTVSEFVSLSAPVDEHCTITRDGDYVRVWRLSGVTFEGVERSAVSARHEALCNFLANLPEDRCSVYLYRIQRRATDRLREPEAPTFSRQFSREYQDRLASEPFLIKDLYIALLYRPFEPGHAHTVWRRSRSVVQLREHQARAVATLGELAVLLEAALADFEPVPLGVRDDGDMQVWESGELFSFLINGRWSRVPVPTAPAWQTLPSVRLSFSGSQIEFKGLEGSRFGVVLDLKEFASEVEPGTLSPLLYVDSEFVETQILSLMSRKRAMAQLKLQRDQLIATEDAVASQVEAMDRAMNDLGDGQFSMGEYSYTLTVFGDTAARAGEAAKTAAAAVGRMSATQLVPVELIADAGWYSQLPGNFGWRTRKASISTRAFAALGCCHTFLLGKRDHNPWGQALAIMRTPAGYPFYFSFHVSSRTEDATDKKYPGNTIVVGQTGSGKTTLLCALLALTPKWPRRPRVVSFALDRDTEITIRALGGVFTRFEYGTPTGLNPFQRDPTEARIGHWTALVRRCIETPELPLLPSQLEAIDRAVRGMASMEGGLRWMSTIRQQLPRDGENSLFNRLARWCRGGELGWVFDSAEDRLGSVLSQPAIGFDYTGIVGSDDVRVPVMMELLHVMGELINGDPMIYHVAECWRALGDPIFADFVKHRQKTIRKMNGVGVFDTQQVEDLLANANGRVMVEQSVTKILLPNPDATAGEYIDGLGLTPEEFEIVKGLGRDGAKRFMVKQAGSSNVCDFSLRGMDDALAVLSTTNDNLALMDEAIAQVGTHPDQWMPVYLERVRQRRRTLRRAA